MITLTRTNFTFAGISAISLLAVTACAGGGMATTEKEPTELETQDKSHEAVFDFSLESDSSSSDVLRLGLPDELSESLNADEGQSILESATVRSTSHPESQCAIEIDYSFVDGAVERIQDDQLWELIVHEPEEYLDNPDDRVPGEAVDITVPRDDRYADALGLSTEQASAVLENEDHTITVPLACASSPTDDSKEVVLTAHFGYVTEREHVTMDLPSEKTMTPTIEQIATVEINTMASGDIHVISSSVNGYHYTGDEHGWLPDDKVVDSQGNVIDG